MTHDELLAKIEDEESLNSQSLGNGSLGDALREGIADTAGCVGCQFIYVAAAIARGKK